MNKRKYNIDDDFFSQIKTSECAYFLGFMYADGTVYERYAKLDLQIDDVGILNQMAQIMNNECPIKIYKNQKTWFYNNNKEKVYYPKKDTCRLCMHSSKIANDLVRAGCGKRKTYNLTFPGEDILSLELRKHFIRGYLDGDGCLSYGIRENNHGGNEHFNLTFTGTFEMVSAIKNVLNEECCTFVGDIRSRKNNGINNYTLTINGNDVILKICNHIYSGSTIHLDRKFNKYLVLKDAVLKRENNPHMHNKKPFKLFYKGKYIKEYASAKELESVSLDTYGVKITNQVISACLHKKYNKNNMYKGFYFEFINQ